MNLEQIAEIHPWPEGWPDIEPVQALDIFEKVKHDLSALAIHHGRRAGVSEFVLDDIAREAVDKARASGMFHQAVDMAKNLPAGNFTVEEVAALQTLGDEAIKRTIASKDPERIRQLRAETPKKLEIGATTTFGDLFDQVNRLAFIFGEEALDFEDQMYRIFGQDADDILFNTAAAASMNVREFFEKHGKSVDELEIFNEETR